MIFTRRDIQQRLDELRSKIGVGPVDQLIRRLNRPGRDRLATMWEVVLTYALSRVGDVRFEVALPSGRRPDILFNGIFTLDVTTVSDEGLDRENPYDELSDQLERLKTKLGLPVGGADLQIGAKRERVRGGERVRLLVPDRPRIAEFVKQRIEPALKEQIAAGSTILHVHIRDEDHDVTVTIDPSKSPYSSGGYASYNIPAARDRNPLYGALKAKARQLKGSADLTGIVVGDAGSRSLIDPKLTRPMVSLRDIIAEFLRQHSSIDFVLVVAVHEEQFASWAGQPPTRNLQLTFMASPHRPAPEGIEQIFREMMEFLPQPRRTGRNAASEAMRRGYGWGHHGGYEMSDRSVKIGSRVLMELLAGRLTTERFNELHGWAHGRFRPAGRNMPNPFNGRLSEGCLPEVVNVVCDPDSDDDWIEFKFGSPDPAISPFR